MLHPVEYLKKVADLIAKIGKVAGLVAALVIWAVGLINKVVAVFLADIAHGLDSLDTSAFRNVVIGGLEYIGYVNAIIPVSEFVVLMGIYLTAWGIVIVLRWVKSVLPTLGN